MNRLTLYLSFILLIALVSCEPSPQSVKPRIVVTTSIIADGLSHICGDDFEVKALMGAGVDPHIYKASQGDVSLLSKADLIVHNGLHLEGKLSELFHKLEKNREVIALSAGIAKDQLIRMDENSEIYDPHIWFSPDLWIRGLDSVCKRLEQLFPENAVGFRQRFTEYSKRIKETEAQLIQKMSTLDAEKRVLITSHDAFGYYGRAFGLEVHGLQGISTVSEFGVRDLDRLSDFVIERSVRAVFVESSVSPKSIEALVENCRKQGHPLSIGGELFSDALGEDGTEEGTYIGMLTHNTETIYKALSE
jgi:manganese/zinc/iron transport system substrate-binding protein